MKGNQQLLRKNASLQKRYAPLDMLRGITLVSMVFYHTFWDIAHLFPGNLPWFRGNFAYIWQQSICWSFILLSGFCWHFSKSHWKRGILLLAAGCVISLVSYLAVPDGFIQFGVLTFLGSAVLLLIPLEKWFQHCPASIGFPVSFLLFLVAKNINSGYLGFENWNFIKLPDGLYHGTLATYLGFTDAAFYSSDYFSVFPWFFLFLTGYFLSRLLPLPLPFLKKTEKGIAPLNFIGRHSMILYLVHQPIIYGILFLISQIQIPL